jgi:hypothetical protein
VYRERERRLAFECDVRKHGRHQRMFGEGAAECRPMPRVVERKRRRGADDAGAADHAVEPRPLHHLQDRRDPATGRPSGHASARSNSTSADAFERFPSLSFSRLMRMALRPPAGL